MSTGRGNLGHLPIPPGVSIPGSKGDAAPGSVLAKLRATAQAKREAQSFTIDLPGRWQGLLRVRYGVIPLDEVERIGDLTNTSNVTASLMAMSRACEAIEAWDQDERNWLVLEDEIGPVTWDDRLTRLLQWPRPADDFEFPIRQVYEGMFDGNGIAIGRHIAEVAKWMGLVEEELVPGESSTASPTPTASPPPTESTPSL